MPLLCLISQLAIRVFTHDDWSSFRLVSLFLSIYSISMGFPSIFLYSLLNSLFSRSFVFFHLPTPPTPTYNWQIGGG